MILSLVFIQLFVALSLQIVIAYVIPLAPREEIISFADIPTCTNTSCFPYHASSIGCLRFTKACFCSALQPLKCANSACLGTDWYAAEDWVASVCGELPTVDFSRLAQCGRSCVREAIIPGWCNNTVVGTASPTRNCFCRVTEENFTGPKFTSCMIEGCGMNETSAQAYLSEFWQDKCLVPANGEEAGNLSGDEVVQFPTDSQQVSAAGGGLSAAERWGLGVGLAASIITILGFIYTWVITIYCFRYRRRRRMQGGSNRNRGFGICNIRGRPPPYSLSED
ncbi:hypothetical protein ABW19_dt0204092 [Dactylella cylindrospora]|nr:hypothetical protein ABW19_dt0204092 [Dactylella cylindrospora]